MENEKIDETAVAREIVERESEKAASALGHELNRELAEAGDPSSNAIRAVVVGGNPQYYRSVLCKLHEQYPDVTFIKHISAGGNNAFFAIDSLNPDIIVIAHDAPIQNAIQFYEAIKTQKDIKGVPYAEKYRDKRIVVLAPNDFNYAFELREHGIQYMLPVTDPRFHSVDTGMLMKVMHDAYADICRAKEERLAGITEHHTVQQQPMVGVGGFVPRQRTEQPSHRGYPFQEEEPAAPHKIIGVYSGTGGSGKTTFATNLASILAKYSAVDYRVCLVEYNLSCRDIDLFFDIKFPPQSKKSITAIAQDADSLYRNTKTEQIEASPREMIPLIARYTERIPSIGLDIIPGISVPLEIDRITKNFSSCFFMALREMYDVVIVDLSADIAKTAMLETMNEIDDFYYIMPMDVPSIRKARVLIKFLSGMYKKSPEEIKVIMNKVDLENESFGIDQVSEVLNDDCTPEGTIPYCDKDLLNSINDGSPIAMSHPEHPVSQAIFSIALGINPMLNMSILEQEQEKEEKKSGMLGKLFGGKKSKSDSEGEEEAKPKKKASMFSKKSGPKQLAAAPRKEKNSHREEMDEDAIDPELEDAFDEEEAPKKSFFGRLFGGLFGGSKKEKTKKTKKLRRK